MMRIPVVSVQNLSRRKQKRWALLPKGVPINFLYSIAAFIVLT